MTDTPRTKAELLALFANNSSQDISAQDMRDFVVSTNLSTSISGAAMTSFRVGTHLAGTFDALTANPLPTEIPAASGTYVGFRMLADGTDSQSALHDPNGWIVSTPFGPEAYWGITHPAYSTLLLPEGIYNYCIRTDVAGSALSATTVINANLDYAEPFDTIDAFTAAYQITNDLSKVFAQDVADTRYYVNGSIAVSTPTHFMPSVIVSNNPNPLQLEAFQVWIYKIR